MTPAEQRIRDVYGFAFPDEFFRFREFLSRLRPGVLDEACDMRPAFPFDVADDKPPKEYPDRPLWEDRYYYDVPEFVTLFNGGSAGLHWGYIFNAPGESPPVVAHYWHGDTLQHAIDADTLFETMRWRVENDHTEFEERVEDPREEQYARDTLAALAEVRRVLGAFWGKEREEIGIDYLGEYDSGSARKPVARTWDDLGIVVPAKLYQPLSLDPFRNRQVSPLRIERIEIEALIAEAHDLLRRGKPGAALKLGRDLWGWAHDFPESYDLLDAAYAALGREPLRRLLAEAKAWRAHCDARRK